MEKSISISKMLVKSARDAFVSWCNTFCYGAQVEDDELEEEYLSVFFDEVTYTSVFFRKIEEIACKFHCTYSVWVTPDAKLKVNFFYQSNVNNLV